jgi:hypothetical protein
LKLPPTFAGQTDFLIFQPDEFAFAAPPTLFTHPFLDYLLPSVLSPCVSPSSSPSPSPPSSPPLRRKPRLALLPPSSTRLPSRRASPRSTSVRSASSVSASVEPRRTTRRTSTTVDRRTSDARPPGRTGAARSACPVSVSLERVTDVANWCVSCSLSFFDYSMLTDFLLLRSGSVGNVCAVTGATGNTCIAGNCFATTCGTGYVYSAGVCTVKIDTLTDVRSLLLLSALSY